MLWLTDITEFKIKGQEEKLNLSPIIDLYNNKIISYTLSNHPTIKLTNIMLKNQKKMNIKQSMSIKGTCLDNSHMENFFGILKQN